MFNLFNRKKEPQSTWRAIESKPVEEEPQKIKLFPIEEKKTPYVSENKRPTLQSIKPVEAETTINEEPKPQIVAETPKPFEPHTDLTKRESLIWKSNNILFNLKINRDLKDYLCTKDNASGFVRRLISREMRREMAGDKQEDKEDVE